MFILPYGPTQPSVQLVTRTATSGVSDLDVQVITHLHLPQMSRMSGATPALPHTSSCRVKEQLTLRSVSAEAGA
jgi:hypothetical protein